GGRSVRLLMQQPEWLDAFRTGLNYPGPAAVELTGRLADISYQAMAALLFAALLGRLVIELNQRRRGRLTITYPDGRRYRGLSGSISVLEASRAIGYPHASVCGGQGRCSTCRVRIIGPGAASLPPPDSAEQKVLE